MNNEIILSALESQLATKKQELELHETSTSEPAFKVLTQEVLESLRENVSTLIPSITLTSDRIEIMKNSQRWSSVTIYLENDWRSTFPSENRTWCAKMNWYGSSATTKEENILNDVQIFGAIASKLSWIEYEFINNWRPKLAEIVKISSDLQEEIRKINSSIYSTQYQIRQQGIGSYKQVGFSCTVIPTLNIEVDWEDENRPYILKGTIANIKLSIGRSKWDYIYAKSFKVIKTNKQKTTLEVTLGNSSIVEHTVTAKSFDNFIDQIYDWQTSNAKKHNDKTTERFNDSVANREKYNK
jgi:hypothetical protein